MHPHGREYFSCPSWEGYRVTFLGANRPCRVCSGEISSLRSLRLFALAVLPLRWRRRRRELDNAILLEIAAISLVFIPPCWCTHVHGRAPDTRGAVAPAICKRCGSQFRSLRSLLTLARWYRKSERWTWWRYGVPGYCFAPCSDLSRRTSIKTIKPHTRADNVSQIFRRTQSAALRGAFLFPTNGINRRTNYVCFWQAN
jgi:hypothetical protein